jgi:hypothetical protein
MLVAIVTTEARSLRLPGTTSVVLSLASLPNSLGRGRGHRQDRCGLTLGLVDLLLFVGLGDLDHALLVALGLVDLGVAFALAASCLSAKSAARRESGIMPIGYGRFGSPM